MELNQQYEVVALSGNKIAEVKLLPQLKEISDLISRTCEYFYKGNLIIENAPFKGFILEGLPGTGKTEIVKQVARKLDRRINGVFFMLVDGASIASPRWGDAEKRLRNVFHKIKELEKEHKDPKLLVLFDDIESLMITRGVELAKEWHYSINSILFHELDDINPLNTIVCATTNRIDLVDDAIKTRLYPIKVSNVPLDQLMSSVEQIIEASNMNKKDKEEISHILARRLEKMENPTIRDARQITVVECIERRKWSV